MSLMDVAITLIFSVAIALVLWALVKGKGG